MPSRARGSTPCGTRSSSSSTRESLPTSSPLRTRSWRLRLGPILRSRSSPRTRSTAVRSLDRSRRMTETIRLQEADCLHLLWLLESPDSLTKSADPPGRASADAPLLDGEPRRVAEVEEDCGGPLCRRQLPDGAEHVDGDGRGSG